MARETIDRKTAHLVMSKPINDIEFRAALLSANKTTLRYVIKCLDRIGGTHSRIQKCELRLARLRQGGSTL